MKEYQVKVKDSSFVAKEAVLVGDVAVGDDCCILFHAVLRGDADKIVIGDKSNVQENCTIHTDFNYPVIVGDRVTIGHNAILHGCTIGDETMVGMGSIVMNGAKIGKHCLIAAGSLITQNKIIPDGMMVMGSPAKAVRPLTKEEIKDVYDSSEEYMEVGENLRKHFHNL
ncbi:MAG: gamma carbonic anhydrase family protein [Anaerostipes sp.]|nr:gamma carbonic anhydrase family protein [Anaerostipes sp.]